MHAVDRLARAHVPVQRLQHQSVTAERHHDVGIIGIVIAVELGQLRQRGLRLDACARDKGDPVVSLGGGHRTTNSWVAPGWRRIAPRSSIHLTGACRDGQTALSRR
jgi:hypothetical protein